MFLVKPKSLAHNPDPQDLRDWVAAMPNARRTEFGNYNVETRVVSRSKASTFVVDDDAQAHSDACITRAKYEEVAKAQDEHIAGLDMVVIDGCIGPEPNGTPVRLYIDKAHANIAAMQQQLYFTPQNLTSFEPRLNVIYTPRLTAPGFPDERLIAVDLKNGVTRVLNSDYFGESKKGGLRMWNHLIHSQGGLAMHAGCKELFVNGQRKICAIIGLSGTGKTTTTFTQQLGSRPIQDDFIGWCADGRVIASENGCFAKTYGLDPGSEPVIHHAVTQPEAYLENVSVDAKGRVNFFDDSYTQNGRATFELSLIPKAGDFTNIPQIDFILILNRNTNIIPAVARLHREQAAAYFMLGETQGTSAGGKDEAGKALRVPGTNPFFPGLHAQQGSRFLELLNKSQAEVYLMNTGWVGGPEGDEHSRKVKIRHSSAVVQGIAEGSIQWAKDPDFGYDVATRCEGFSGDDEMLLRPVEWYTRTGRESVYRSLVDRLKTERRTHLQSYPGLPGDIVASVS